MPRGMDLIGEVLGLNQSRNLQRLVNVRDQVFDVLHTDRRADKAVLQIGGNRRVRHQEGRFHQGPVATEGFGWRRRRGRRRGGASGCLAIARAFSAWRGRDLMPCMTRKQLMGPGGADGIVMAGQFVGGLWLVGDQGAGYGGWPLSIRGPGFVIHAIEWKIDVFCVLRGGGRIILAIAVFYY